MKKIFLILVYLVSFTGIIVTAVLYPSLPEVIPMHWDMNGVIDSYGTKLQAFIMPVVSVFLITAMLLFPRIDPKKESYKSFGMHYDIFIFVLSLFFFVMQSIILKASFNPASIQMNNLMPVIIGSLFSVIGMLMPKFAHNYFIGIKLPWTLSSTENWEKTHKFAGPVWIAGGVLTILCGFLLAAYAFYVSMAIIVLMVLVPAVYSYILFKRSLS